MRILTAILLLVSSSYAVAQKPMAGNYLWKGQQFYQDTLFLDTGLYDITQGFFLKLDSTGSSATGYYTIVLDSVGAVSGTVKGTGTSPRVPFWAASDSLSGGVAGIEIDAGSQSLQLSGTVALTVVGVNKPVQFSNALGTEVSEIYQTVDDLVLAPDTDNGLLIETFGGSALHIDRLGNSIFNEDMNATSRAFFLADTDTALFVSPVADGAIGIHTAQPATPLHIVGVGGTEVLLTLENNAVSTPAAEMGTLNNMPTGMNGDPDIFIQISINGNTYVLPGWQTP